LNDINLINVDVIYIYIYTYRKLVVASGYVLFLEAQYEGFTTDPGRIVQL